MSDWVFEPTEPTALEDLFGDDGAPPQIASTAVTSPAGTEDDILLLGLADLPDDQQVVAFYDSGWDSFPMGPGVTPQPDPDPVPVPVHTGGEFDYSSIFPTDSWTTWNEWFGEYSGPGQIWTSDGFDSLAPYMNGEWHFDIDPEMLDRRFWQGVMPPTGGSGNPYANQFGFASLMGIQTPQGMLVPIYRTWSEVIYLPPENPNDPNEVAGVELRVHREFLGFKETRQFDLASLGNHPLEQAWDYLNRNMNSIWPFVGSLMTVDSIAGAFNDLTKGLTGGPNTPAAVLPPMINMQGRLQAEVRDSDGNFIGHVAVDGQRYILYTANGQAIIGDPPLTQHWNELAGVRYMEQMAHQERTMGLPFAQGILGLATTAAGGPLGHWAKEIGFSAVTEFLVKGTMPSAVAIARLKEAAFELRHWQLVNGNP